MATTSLFALLYRSEASADLLAADVMEICETSVDANAADNITGILLCTDEPEGSNPPVDTFVQWLEGPEREVRALYDRIQKDSRHIDCEVLAEGPSAELLTNGSRLFPDWSMRFERVSSLPVTAEGVQKISDAFLFGSNTD